MLEARNVSLCAQKVILNDVSLKLNRGTSLGLIGKSGAGKSSLLKILSGLLPSTKGFVFLNNKKIFGPWQQLVPGHTDIQMVNQDFKLDLYKTVVDNIGEKVSYLREKERNELVLELLKITELEDLANQKAICLSGGEQQRLAIARALACEPDFLLLDEPFVHLDQRIRTKILIYIKSLQRVRNVGIIIVSHDGSELLGFCDELMYLHKGKIARRAKTLEFYYKPKSKTEALLLGPINSIFLNGKRILFRPNEYSLNRYNKEDQLNVNFIHFFFNGMVYENYFTTLNNESIVLYSMNSLENIKSVKIEKK